MHRLYVYTYIYIFISALRECIQSMHDCIYVYIYVYVIIYMTHIYIPAAEFAQEV